jgi:Mn-containing catalase
MFRHSKQLQFRARPEKPDALFAAKLQEIIGGQFGEMSVMMQYLWQGWTCRMPGKYKDMLMDIGTEEIGHVEMLVTMQARLLEGAPAETTAKAAAANPALAAVLGGMNPQQAIIAGGNAMPTNSMGVFWNAGYIVASGNLLADFRANVAAEAQGRLQASRLYGMTDDAGVKEMLAFNLARDTYHQQQWLAAIEELRADGLIETYIEDSRADAENQEHNHTFWDLSDGSESSQGRWARGPRLDGRGTNGDGDFRYLTGTEAGPIGGDTNEVLPAPDPLLFATYDGAFGPGTPGSGPGALQQGAENLVKKAKDILT